MDRDASTAADTARNRRYWQRTRRLTGWLLLLWAGVCFGLTWFARELSTVHLFGWPVGFWAAAQGALFVFIGIVAFYAYAMNRLEAD